MTCDRRDDVAALILGGLPPAEALAVEEHLLGCDECAAERRELAIVRSMLDTLDRPGAGPPADLLADVAAPPDAEIAAVTGVRQHRSRRDVRLLTVAVAAAFLVGLLPPTVWLATHRETGPGPVELAGTAAAPDAWATVRFVPRTEGTIVDVEAGDLPTTGGRYAVVVSGRDGELARQEFAVDPDGWAQVVLGTPRPVAPGDTVLVQRVDGGAPVTVLSCNCTV